MVLWTLELIWVLYRWQFLLTWWIRSAHLYWQNVCSSKEAFQSSSYPTLPIQQHRCHDVLWKFLGLTKRMLISQLATLDSAAALWVSRLPDPVQRFESVHSLKELQYRSSPMDSAKSINQSQHLTAVFKTECFNSGLRIIFSCLVSKQVQCDCTAIKLSIHWHLTQ